MPDFNFKSSFPIADVINAAQRKAQIEQQNQQNGQQQLLAGLQSIGQVGQSLVDKRRKVAQALALGKQFDIPDEVAKTMEPEEVLKVGAIKKGQVDMNMLMNYLHPGFTPNNATAPAAATPDAKPAAAASLPTPAQMPNAGTAPVPGITPPAPSPMPVPSSGLTPPTTGSMPVPIAAPPAKPQMVNKATADLVMKAEAANRLDPVVTEQAALEKGGVQHGTHIVKPANSTDKISWDTASDQQKALAQAVYEGRVRPADVGFRERGKITLLANEYGIQNHKAPFKSYAADVNAAMGKYSTSGKMGQNSLSLNTALGHLSSAYDSYEKIGNTNQEWLNVPINTLKKNTNDPEVVALGINLNALQGELANVFKNTGATDQEISHWQQYLNENLTPQQYIGAASKIDELLKSRLDAMEYQRSQAGGGNGAPLISPHAKDISEKLQKVQSAPAQTGDSWKSEDEQKYQMLTKKKKNGTIKS